MPRSLQYLIVPAVFIVASGFQCGVDGDGTVSLTCDSEPCLSLEDESGPPVSTQGTSGTSITLSPTEKDLERHGTYTFEATVTLAGGITDSGISCSATGGVARPTSPSS